MPAMLCPFKKYFRSLQNPHGIHSLLFTYRKDNTLSKYFYNGPNNSQLPFLVWQDCSSLNISRGLLEGNHFRISFSSTNEQVGQFADYLFSPSPPNPWTSCNDFLGSRRTSASQNSASKYVNDSL